MHFGEGSSRNIPFLYLFRILVVPLHFSVWDECSANSGMMGLHIRKSSKKSGGDFEFST